MKEIRNCKIVQDLLPNYIDGLTNEETNLFIEEHLKECSKCKQIFDNMKQELTTVNNPTRNSREVKYIKKYNKKLKVLKLTVFILLIIALGVITNYYFTMRDAYLKAANIMVDMVSEGMYPDTFYATVEEISDPGVYGMKEIKVKGLNINDKNHRDEYTFSVPLDNIGDNFKIKWNGKDINFEQLKVGQTVAIYNYEDISKVGIPEELHNIEDKSKGELSQVRMMVVLDDTL